MAEKTPRDAQEEGAAAPETTPQAALHESKEAGTGGAYVSPEGAEPEGEAAKVFEIAVLPLQQTTMFPGTVIPLAAGRPRSVAAVEAALSTEEKLLACVTVREERATPESEATPPADLYEAGTLVMVKRMMRATEGLQLIVHGTERVRVVRWTQTDPHLRARVRILPAPAVRDADAVEALTRNVQALIQRALAMLPEIPPEIRTAVLSSNDPTQLAYFLASIL
ncbi:MAG TPA: LON peptidase substrate-binding domain-containing protein, partial [Pyrinomonadaceae bacterium]